MRITGPNWPSTRALQEALSDTPGEVFHWGQGGRNGLQQLEAFQAAGLACPTFTTNLTQAKDWVRSGIPTFGRNLHHTQGKDIVDAKYTQTRATPATPARTELRYITTRKGNRVQRPFTVPGTPGKVAGDSWNQKWLAKDFWVKVIDVAQEYRQHVFGEKGIRRGKKIKVEEPITPLPIRSRRNGWHLDYGQFTPPPGLRDLAKAAVASLGYTHGAVDIVEDSQGKLYVLEVNSAPSLQDLNTLKVYVDAIKARE